MPKQSKKFWQNGHQANINGPSRTLSPPNLSILLFYPKAHCPQSLHTTLSPSSIISLDFPFPSPPQPPPTTPFSPHSQPPSSNSPPPQPTSASPPPSPSSCSPTQVTSPPSQFTLTTPCSSTQLSIFYFNARSLFPKLDELKLLCVTHSPDIVCITETWLSSDILDSELNLHNYLLFRLDRNRHGGGIAMLVKSSLSPSFISLPSSNLEFLIISVKFRKRSLFIGTFYRPPSSLHDLSVLSSTLQNLRHSVLSNLILVGDFNVHYSPSSSSSLYRDLKSIAVSYSLSQVITDPTHFSHSGSPSIIDLVFLPSTFSSNYAILPPVSSSDHNSILLSVSPPSFFHRSPKPTRRRVWPYSQADLSKINNLLSSTSWDLSSDIDTSWLSFKSHFLKIMHTSIPSKLLPDSPLPPWINRSLAVKMRTCQRLYIP